MELKTTQEVNTRPFMLILDSGFSSGFFKTSLKNNRLFAKKSKRSSLEDAEHSFSMYVNARKAELKSFKCRRHSSGVRW